MSSSKEGRRLRLIRLVNTSIKLITASKSGKLSVTAIIVALILASLGASACSENEQSGCINWSAYWEASNR